MYLSKVLYKFDNKGNVKEILQENLKNIKEFNMASWDQNMFLTACILSGCDYLNSIDKIGIKTAFKLVNDNRTFKSIIKKIKIENKFIVPKNYEKDF